MISEAPIVLDLVFERFFQRRGGLLIDLPRIQDVHVQATVLAQVDHPVHLSEPSERGRADSTAIG